MFKKHYLNFIYSLVLVSITAFLSSYYNDSAMITFYPKLTLPPLTPPDFVFPIVWIILYTMMIIAFDIVLNHEITARSKFAIQLFIVNLILQVLWSFVFFYNGYFLIGFAVLVMLDVLVGILITKFYQIKKIAGILLFPYVLWLLFATYLNWGIVDLNGASYLF